MGKVRELEEGCSGGHWSCKHTALKPLRDTRDILKAAAGHDVGELDERINVVEAAMHN
jgi:hypothetical protein